MHKSYIVIETKNITNSMITESLHTNNKFRKSIDCICSILKFDSLHPDIMAGYVKYTHEEIIQYLSDNSVDWVEVVE